MTPTNTHADYIVSTSNYMADDHKHDRDDDHEWLSQHLANYTSQNSLHSGTNANDETFNIMDDKSAVIQMSNGKYVPFEYLAEDFPHIEFAPTLEQRTEWFYLSQTIQDYAGIQDLTNDLRNALNDCVQRHLPGSEARRNFLTMLEYVNLAYDTITYKNHAPRHEWRAWLKNHTSWLESKSGQVDDLQTRVLAADISAMVAVAGRLRA